jgi:hypothetical protein
MKCAILDEGEYSKFTTYVFKPECRYDNVARLEVKSIDIIEPMPRLTQLGGLGLILWLSGWISLSVAPMFLVAQCDDCV